MRTSKSLFYFFNSFNVPSNKRAPIHLVYVGDSKERLLDLCRYAFGQLDIPYIILNKHTNFTKILKYLDCITDKDKLFFVIEDLEKFVKDPLLSFYLLDLAGKGVLYKPDGLHYSLRFLIITDRDTLYKFLKSNTHLQEFYKFLGRVLFTNGPIPKKVPIIKKRKVVIENNIDNYLEKVSTDLAYTYIKYFIGYMPSTLNFNLLKYSLRSTLLCMSYLEVMSRRHKKISKKIIDKVLNYVMYLVL